MVALVPVAQARPNWAARLVVPFTLCLVLTALDLGTKVWLVTPAWAWHREHSLISYALVLVPIAFLAWRVTVWAGAVFLASWLGNIFLVGDGGVANPISVDTGSGVIVFNLADLYLWAGVLVLSTSIAAWLVER